MSGVPCGDVVCMSVGTLLCDEASVTCVCKDTYTGVLCETQFFMLRPDLFYALYGTFFPLMALLAVAGIVLLFFYFCKFVPATGMDARNPQVVGLAFCVTGCLMRALSHLIALAVGPVLRFEYFNSPNSIHAVVRLFYGLFYPLVLAAFTLQVLLWVEVSSAVKRLQVQARTWLPRLRIVFFPALALLFVLEITTQCLLIYGVGRSSVLLAYRIMLLVYLVAVVALALVFGIKLLRVMAEQTRSQLVVTAQAERVVASRRTLSRLVFTTCILLVLGIIITSVALVRSFSSSPERIFAIDFVTFAFSVAAVSTIVWTFYQMMRNRMTLGMKGISASSSTATPSSPVNSAGMGGSSVFAAARRPLLSSQASAIVDNNAEAGDDLYDEEMHGERPVDDNDVM